MRRQGKSRAFAPNHSRSNGTSWAGFGLRALDFGLFSINASSLGQASEIEKIKKKPRFSVAIVYLKMFYLIIGQNFL